VKEWKEHGEENISNTLELMNLKMNSQLWDGFGEQILHALSQALRFIGIGSPKFVLQYGKALSPFNPIIKENSGKFLRHLLMSQLSEQK
jgi:hypothetical protein